MKATDEFKRIIKAYLDRRAAEDELFAASYAKPAKNIDECSDYILQTVEASGVNGYADEEIFSMAVHYYDEDDLGAIKGASGRVVVNHHIELSDEEKATARAQAIAKYQADIIAEQKAKEERAAKRAAERAAERAKNEVSQPSLFDL